MTPAPNAVESPVESRSDADPEEYDRLAVNHVEETVFVIGEMHAPRFRRGDTTESLDSEPRSGRKRPSSDGRDHAPAFVADPRR